jgi:hypothetical protein
VPLKCRVKIHARPALGSGECLRQGAPFAFLSPAQKRTISEAEKEIPMLLLIIVLVLLFGGGGGYYGYSRWGTGGGMGIVGTVLLILLLLYLFGGLRV